VADPFGTRLKPLGADKLKRPAPSFYGIRGLQPTFFAQTAYVLVPEPSDEFPHRTGEDRRVLPGKRLAPSLRAPSGLTPRLLPSADRMSGSTGGVDHADSRRGWRGPVQLPRQRVPHYWAGQLPLSRAVSPALPHPRTVPNAALDITDSTAFEGGGLLCARASKTFAIICPKADQSGRGFIPAALNAFSTFFSAFALIPSVSRISEAVAFPAAFEGATCSRHFSFRSNATTSFDLTCST